MKLKPYVMFCIVGLALSEASYAAPFTEVTVVSKSGPFHEILRSDYSEEGISSASSKSVSGGFSESTVSAGMGVIKGKVIQSGEANGMGMGAYNDELILSRSDLDGKTGSITIAHYYDYRLATFERVGDNDISSASVAFTSIIAANGAYSGQVIEHLNVQGDHVSAEYRKNDDYHDITELSYDGVFQEQGYLIVTAEFTWGGMFTSGLHLFVHGQTTGGASVEVDAFNSGYWAGILSATYDGQEITDYTLTSASGTDYSRSFVPRNSVAVPEPGTLGLLGVGIAVIGFLRRRPTR